MVTFEKYMKDPAAKERIIQKREINRVKKNIQYYVLEFCRQHLKKIFLLSELEEYVRSYIQVTPGSAGRILRLLRKAGKVDYEIVRRSCSLYYIKDVK